jgi:CheY-like chemotaxis protein
LPLPITLQQRCPAADVANTRKDQDMTKRVMIVDSGGAAYPLFRAALAPVEDMELYVADNGHQAAELLAGLGETSIMLVDIELPFLALLEFLACDLPPDPVPPPRMTVVCSQRNAAALERGLGAGMRAVA